MDEAEFWALISQVTDVRFNKRAQALQARLETLQPDQLTGFADRLHELLGRLRTPEHAEACNGVGDAFLYMRCAVVLTGETTYRRVAAHPADMAAFDGREAETLLDVAARAYEASTGMLWEHDPESTGDDPFFGWLRVFFQSEGDPWAGEPELEYELATDALVDELRRSDAWMSWWGNDGHDELTVTVRVGADQPAAPSVRRGHRIVELVVHWTAFGSHSAAGAPLPQQAYDDMVTLLSVIQQTLQLPPLPPLPDPVTLDPEFVEEQRRARQ